MDTSKFELYKNKVKELSSIATDIFNSIVPNETYLHITGPNGNEELYIKVCIKIPLTNNGALYDIAIEGPAVLINYNGFHEKVSSTIYTSTRRNGVLTSFTSDPSDDSETEVITQQEFENACNEAAKILK